jgi:hypothetical protein
LEFSKTTNAHEAQDVLTAERTKHLETAYDNLAKSGAKPEELPKKLNDAVNNLLTSEQKETMKGGGSTGLPGGAAPGAALGAPQISCASSRIPRRASSAGRGEERRGRQTRPRL